VCADKAVVVQDIEDIEDVPRAVYEAEQFGDAHGVARLRAGEQLAGLRALERVKASGSAGLLHEGDRGPDPGLGEDGVLPVDWLLIGRHPFGDGIDHDAPRPLGPSRPWPSFSPVISRR
jgi:hypothetical protein